MASAVAYEEEGMEPDVDKDVVFYAWSDAGTQSMPSSVTIHISGGERVRDASGKIMAVGHKEVQFNKGILRTRDPQVIRAIRKLIEGGDTITEDKETYLSMVEPGERRAARLVAKNYALVSELSAKDKEIEDLKAKLANRE